MEINYAGYFDDFGCRFGFGINEPSQVEAHLLELALRGSPIVINDGYFFSNPGLYTLLEKEARNSTNAPCTILGALMSSGFIRTLSRETRTQHGELRGSFVGALNAMLAAGVKPGGVDLNNSSNVRNKNDLTALLVAFDARNLHTSIPWPAHDKDQIFQKVVEYLLEKKAEPREAIRTKITEVNANGKRLKRTDFESLIRDAEPKDKENLARLANDAYLLTFGAWLEKGKGDLGAGANCFAGVSFGLTAQPSHAWEEFVNKTPVDFAANEVLEVGAVMPRFNLQNKGHLAALTKLTTAGSDSQKQKIALINARCSVISEASDSAKTRYKDAYRSYVDQLNKELIVQNNKTRSDMLTVVPLSTISEHRGVYEGRRPTNGNSGNLAVRMIQVAATSESVWTRQALPVLLSLDHDGMSKVINWTEIKKYERA